MSSSNTESSEYTVVTYTAGLTPSKEICDQALKVIGTHEDRDTLNGMFFENGTKATAGNLPYYKFHIMKDPHATTHVCLDKSNTVRGVLIHHGRNERTETQKADAGSAWSDQFWLPSGGDVAEAEHKMRWAVSGDEHAKYSGASDICVLSVPKSGDPSGKLIGEALLKAMPSDVDFVYTGLLSELFKDNGFKPLGSPSGYSEVSEKAPYQPPSGEIEVAFLLKEKDQHS